MDRLPTVLDIRDDLRAAREASDRDIEDDVEAVVGRLEEYTERDIGDREGLLDDADNHLLRLQTQADDGEAAERFQAARNRIHLFRDSLAGQAGGPVVIDARVAETDADDERDDRRLDELRGAEVTVHATVINEGDAGDVLVEAGFYDADSDRIESTESNRFAMDAGEQQTVELDAAVPERTDYYTTVARRVGE